MLTLMLSKFEIQICFLKTVKSKLFIATYTTGDVDRQENPAKQLEQHASLDKETF